MPLYDYRCFGHEVLRRFPMGEAPATVDCPEHQHQCKRSFGSQRTNNNDQFRSYHLSSKADKAAEAQGRAVTGPRDREEAKAMGAATGRIYIGDDTSQLSASAQRAIGKTFAAEEQP